MLGRFFFIAALLCATPAIPAPVESCNQSAGAILHVPLQAHPFGVLAAPDGCTIFVSMIGEPRQSPSGIGIFKRAGGKVTPTRFLPDNDAPLGMVLTHDGKLLIIANNTNVVFLDVAKAISGETNPVVGTFSEPGRENPNSTYINVTADDRFVFVADEGVRTISVIDLEKARASNFGPDAFVGKIPVGNAPIGLSFSPDERLLYTTSQGAPIGLGWPRICKPEGQDPKTARPENPEGAVIVIDVERAKQDPEHAVLGTIPAGCSPVRLVLSPRGNRAYVTARNDNALIVFDTAKLLGDPLHARIASIPVGTAPVGVALADNGRKAFVANSNRFFARPNESQTLSVIDTTRLQEGSRAVLGTIPAGSFPRELSVTKDGRTLLVTNFSSNTLELVDLDHLPLQRAQ